MKQYNGEKAIISLTSWKARINTVCKTLFSLIDQCPGFHIVLVLSEEEFPKKEDELPENLKIFIDNDLIEVLWTEYNLKSHKKYFYAMRKYKDLPIITVDDDQLAITNFAEILFGSYKKDPKKIYAGRVHKIKYRDKKLLKYANWDWEYKKIEANHFIFPTGAGSVLYPPSILNITESDIPLIKAMLNQDDIFLKYKSIENNVFAEYVPGIKFIELPDECIKRSALSNDNVKNRSNDVIIKNYLEKALRKFI